MTCPSPLTSTALFCHDHSNTSSSLSHLGESQQHLRAEFCRLPGYTPKEQADYFARIQSVFEEIRQLSHLQSVTSDRFSEGFFPSSLKRQHNDLSRLVEQVHHNHCTLITEVIASEERGLRNTSSSLSHLVESQQNLRAELCFLPGYTPKKQANYFARIQSVFEEIRQLSHFLSVTSDRFSEGFFPSNLKRQHKNLSRLVEEAHHNHCTLITEIIASEERGLRNTSSSLSHLVESQQNLRAELCFLPGYTTEEQADYFARIQSVFEEILQLSHLQSVTSDRFSKGFFPSSLKRQHKDLSRLVEEAHHNHCTLITEIIANEEQRLPLALTQIAQKTLALCNGTQFPGTRLFPPFAQMQELKRLSEETHEQIQNLSLFSKEIDQLLEKEESSTKLKMLQLKSARFLLQFQPDKQAVLHLLAKIEEAFDEPHIPETTIEEIQEALYSSECYSPDQKEVWEELFVSLRTSARQGLDSSSQQQLLFLHKMVTTSVQEYIEQTVLQKHPTHLDLFYETLLELAIPPEDLSDKKGWIKSRIPVSLALQDVGLVFLKRSLA